MFKLILAWFPKAPTEVQLELPFWCKHYGEECREFSRYNVTGFYGRCVKCGVIYAPECDR